MLTAKQLEERRRGMGGSDVAPALGQSRFGTPIGVWEEKTGRRPPSTESTEAMDWGNLLEDPLRQHYARRHGLVIEVPGQLQHPTLPWALGNPDGLVYESLVAGKPVGLLHGLEVKTTEPWLASEWGPAGTDEVPIEYLLQAAWYMAVTDLDRWDVTVAIGRQIRDYHLRRDRQLEEMLIEGVGRFWVEHVLADKAPQPDGSKTYRAHLERLYPQHVERVINTTREQDELVAQYREARKVAEETERKAEALKQRIQLEMADASVFDSVHGRITWKRSRDGSRTDWEAVAMQLAPVDVIEPIRAAHTRAVPGSRRFNVPRIWSKEE